jgi:hypothetical protein
MKSKKTIEVLLKKEKKINGKKIKESSAISAENQRNKN